MEAICKFDKNDPHNKMNIEGYIDFYQPDQFCDTSIVISLKGFGPRKTHAIHIHEKSDFSNGCMSAGGHYNPFGQTHGNYKLHGQKRHVGDLVNNITSNDYGDVYVEFTDDLVSLYEPHSVLDRSIVIHEKKDDLGMGGNAESLITGNAGGRMACTAIRLYSK